MNPRRKNCKSELLVLRSAWFECFAHCRIVLKPVSLGISYCDPGTSVAANYRAACEGRSPADFISKLGIVEEEADARYSGWSSWSNQKSYVMNECGI
jgi:hypothetical protein